MSLESEDDYRSWVAQGASPVMVAQHAHARGVHLLEIMALLRSLFPLGVIEAKEYAIQGVHGLNLNDYQEQYIWSLLTDSETEETAEHYGDPA